jgi:hypothetical protein
MFVLYLLYKIIFDFIIPVARASSSVKTKIKQMQEDQFNQQPNPAAREKTMSKKSKEQEYIDFEELK